MKKVKIGVFGAGRGSSMVKYCRMADNAELVAICDKWEEALNAHKEAWQDENITYYTNFEDFIKHDMDAVVLSNYAHEHAPFAMKAIKAGKHVFSEVLAAKDMKEAIELIETVESHDRIYAYGENYCYMHAAWEMKKIYEQGEIGELEYAECEYIHNCESIWPALTYGDPNHWRNNMSSFGYCTHSIGPIVHATKLRPVSVTGLEPNYSARRSTMGNKGGEYGIEMLRMENGAIVKSIHGGLYKDSIWFSMYGRKGRVESGRHDPNVGEKDVIFSGLDKVYVNVDSYAGEYAEENIRAYEPHREFDHLADALSHAGSDFYSMWHFVEKILGNPDADIVDVYEAMDMTLPGIFAHKSAQAGGIPMEIPDLRKTEERERWRNDTTSSFPEHAGDMYLSPEPLGSDPIPDEVYEQVRANWNRKLRYNLK